MTGYRNQCIGFSGGLIGGIKLTHGSESAGRSCYNSAKITSGKDADLRDKQQREARTTAKAIGGFYAFYF